MAAISFKNNNEMIESSLKKDLVGWDVTLAYLLAEVALSAALL